MSARLHVNTQLDSGVVMGVDYVKDKCILEFLSPPSEISISACISGTILFVTYNLLWDGGIGDICGQD